MRCLCGIDTSLFTSEQKTLVRLDSPWTSVGGVLRLGAVAVTALQGVVGLHASPSMNRQLQPLVQKLFARADRSEKLPQTSIEACILRAILCVHSCGT